jgi:hypothetical protein
VPLQQTGPNTHVLTVGADDDTDGISLFVTGEDFPRVSITSAGVAVGDGTEAPTLLEVPA